MPDHNPRIIPVFLPHLGCGERCIYCDQSFITETGGSGISPAVHKAIESVEGRFEIGLFGGNMFGVKPETLKGIFASFERYGRKITNFRISTKPVPMREDILDILKENGVTVIELGMPTFNDGILRTLNRLHTVAEFYEAFYALKDRGFAVAIQVMVGLPGESRDDVGVTAKNILRIIPEYMRIYPLVVIEGTPLHSMYEKGLYSPVAFREALDRSAYLYLTAGKKGIKTVKMGLTDNEIIKTKIVAGHYHPAFGYMARSRAFYLAVKGHCDGLSLKGDVVVRLNKRDVPHLVGHKRSNLDDFCRDEIRITWVEDDLSQGSFIIEYSAGEILGDIFKALETLGDDRSPFGSFPNPDRIS